MNTGICKKRASGTATELASRCANGADGVQNGVCWNLYTGYDEKVGGSA
jgi:hypothetical protein